MNEKQITTKTTHKALKNIRKIAAETGEKQYQVMERLSENELKALKTTETDLPATIGENKEEALDDKTSS